MIYTVYIYMTYNVYIYDLYCIYIRTSWRSISNRASQKYMSRGYPCRKTPRKNCFLIFLKPWQPETPIDADHHDKITYDTTCILPFPPLGIGVVCMYVCMYGLYTLILYKFRVHISIIL